MPYGTPPDECVDAFPALRPNSPIHIFLHGGYWRALSKDDASFYATPLVLVGAAFIAVNYSLAPAASLDAIVDQCRRAVAWAHANASSLNADPGKLYVAGHSAGGHLAGMMAITDWRQQFGLPRDAIKGVTAVSGLYDLEPVRRSQVNGWLGLDEAGAARNSPIRHLPDSDCPLVVAWAEGETGEFIRQSREFAAAWRSKGFSCSAIEEPRQNHFSVIELMGSPTSTLGRAVLAQMGLSAP